MFDEQAFWHQQSSGNATSTRKNQEEDYKKTDLFENHQMQEEASGSTSESSFEQLCSIRASDHGSGPVTNPFSASSKVHDEVEEGQDEY